jgi:hypothetical protein
MQERLCGRYKPHIISEAGLDKPLRELIIWDIEGFGGYSNKT